MAATLLATWFFRYANDYSYNIQYGENSFNVFFYLKDGTILVIITFLPGRFIFCETTEFGFPLSASVFALFTGCDTTGSKLV